MNHLFLYSIQHNPNPFSFTIFVIYSLDTVVQMSKNARAFLKPHIHTLVPIMLESLSGLEPQQLNYLATRVAGNEDIQQRLDKARVAAFKMSPMMDSINLVRYANY